MQAHKSTKPISKGGDDNGAPRPGLSGFGWAILGKLTHWVPASLPALTCPYLATWPAPSALPNWRLFLQKIKRRRLNGDLEEESMYGYLVKTTIRAGEKDRWYKGPLILFSFSNVLHGLTHRNCFICFLQKTELPECDRKCSCYYWDVSGLSY